MLRDLSPFLASFGSKMANVEAFGDAAAIKVPLFLVIFISLRLCTSQFLHVIDREY